MSKKEYHAGGHPNVEDGVAGRVVKYIEDAGGEIREAGILPDGSGFATVSFPLRKDHWIYAETEDYEPPPMVMRMGTDHPGRKTWESKIRQAGRYAVRASTMNGKEMDFDPDALVQNLVVAMLGYCTPDGLSQTAWANPPTSSSEEVPWAESVVYAVTDELVRQGLEIPEHHGAGLEPEQYVELIRRLAGQGQESPSEGEEP